MPTAAASWTLTNVFFRDAKNGWAFGFAGQLIRSRDGGKTWEAQKTELRSWFTSMVVDKSNRLWITADDQFLMSQDGGEKWTAVDVDDQIYLREFIFVGDQLWALGQLGLLRQDNAGKWKAIDTLVPGGSVKAVSAASPSE
jgi:photosystem II stability/assembly factor-like uncharacterized protein